MSAKDSRRYHAGAKRPDNGDGLDERKRLILRNIIDDYILTATPVGSRAISKRSEIGFSSATIRNEMSDLEEMGFLEQPHTSAGRIPSDKAYRLYVDQLMRRPSISKKQRQIIQQRIIETIDEWKELASQTAKMLSQLTQLPSIVMTSDATSTIIRHVQLVPVSTGRALAVIVTDSAEVHDMLMSVPEGFGAEQLEKASRMLTSRLAGCDLYMAGDVIKRELAGEFSQYETFWRELGGSIDKQHVRGNRNRIAFGGAATLLMHPEFSDVQSAQHILTMLETEDALYHILAGAQPMKITISIGAENARSEMKDSSIVTASFQIGESHTGSFGVIGPTRMDYARVAALVEAMAQGLSLIFGAQNEQEADEKRRAAKTLPESEGPS